MSVGPQKTPGAARVLLVGQDLPVGAQVAAPVVSLLRGLEQVQMRNGFAASSPFRLLGAAEGTPCDTSHD